MNSATQIQKIKGVIDTNPRNGMYKITCEDGLLVEIPVKNVNLNVSHIEFCNENKIYLVPLHAPQSNTIDEVVLPLSLPDINNEEENVSLNNIVDGNKVYWSDAATLLLLELYKTKSALLSSRKIKSLKALWKIIAEEMYAGGYEMSNDQVENKYKALVRQYKFVKSNNNNSGRGRKTMWFEKELDDIFQKKHNINPVALSGRNGFHIFQKETSVNNKENELSLLQESIINEEHEDDPSSDYSARSSPLESVINTPVVKKKLHLGKTAEILQNCFQEIHQFRESAATDSNKRFIFEKDLMDLYKKETESAAQFREQSLILKKEKNMMLQMFFAENTKTQ